MPYPVSLSIFNNIIYKTFIKFLILYTTIHFHNLPLCPTASAKTLGVIFGSDLNYKSHISSICRSSFYLIRQLHQVRSSLDESSVNLANSLVHSKLDYCNSFSYGLPFTITHRLQIVQNSLGRVVCNISKFQTSSKPLLKSLHWLPIHQRIQYKIALLTFKTLQIGKPFYLADLLTRYRPVRNLRSASADLLVMPYIRSTLGRRSFSFAAPAVWNSLPPRLRSCTSLSDFCFMLKTHLFPP